MDGLESLLPLGFAFLATGGTDGSDYEGLKRELRSWAADDPMDALLLTAFGGGIAFWLAERGKNPAIETPWDAILYVATSFSVGYDNTFPTTQAGHAIATMVQTFGPALASKAFDPPAAEVAAEPDVNREILARLDEIVRLLQPRHG